ncbi:S53 family peptidase [uncultured Shewanella sp.]|uniref:S53 family peptidase n=1 Tax=uncultured Shewanella sp. TaxID=173975 RepID=UPI0026321889|nr:S53 family peptidase [uncultured Shewanella sp.]
MIMFYRTSKEIMIIISVLLLSACSNEDDNQQCTAPDYNVDGTLTQYKSLHCYTPQDIHDAYQLNALYDMGLTGEGGQIVIIDSFGSPTAKEDLLMFHDTFFPEQLFPTFQALFPFGEPNNDDSWEIEVSLDIQWAHAIAPRANIDLIVLPDEENIYTEEAIAYIVEEYPAGTIVSMSFGDIESNYTALEIENLEEAFQAGVMKGITFFASTGDIGSSNGFSEKTVSYPASSPFVTAVGGTFLQYGWSRSPTSNKPYLNSGDRNPNYFNINPILTRLETVWNEPWVASSTGGGSSILFDIPKWQASVKETIYTNSGNGRGIPDLAWNAAVNGAGLIYTDGVWGIEGGTSASVPQVAAFFVLINQYLAEQGMGYIGHLNPLLYQINDNTAYNDILPLSQGTVLAGEQQNNQTFTYLDDGTVVYGDVPGYPTTVGWDMTTGFGSPRGKHFLNALVKVMSDDDN